MRGLLVCAALSLTGSMCLADPTPLTLLDLTDGTVQPQKVDPDYPVASGFVHLVFPASGDTSLIVLGGIYADTNGHPALTKAQLDAVSGRIGVAIEVANGIVSLKDAGSLEADLDGDGVNELVTFCLEGTQAVLTAYAPPDPAPLWRRAFALPYDAEPTC